MKIVLTGGIAAGKSAATEYLKTKGFAVIDADEISREVIRDPDIAARLAANYGMDILTPNGVDRRLLRARALVSRESAETLNGIMHGAIYEILQQRFAEQSGDTVAAIPLYFETSYRLQGVDEVWTVAADAGARIKRLMQRDTNSKESARQLVGCQLSDAERAVQADRVLYNDGSLEEFYIQIDEALKGR